MDTSFDEPERPYVETTYRYWNTGGTYDHQTNGTEQYGRLYELKTVKTGTPDTVLQDVTHTWDAVGNLTQRQNVVDVETESFGYDFLDRLTSESNYLFKFGDTGDTSSRLGSPRRLAVDASGNIFVADTGNNRVSKFNSSGVFQYAFGSYGTGDGQFNQPSGVATAVIGSDLFVVVTDLGNCRVQKLKEQNGALVFVSKWGEYGTARSRSSAVRGHPWAPAGPVATGRASSVSSRTRLTTKPVTVYYYLGDTLIAYKAGSSLTWLPGPSGWPVFDLEPRWTESGLHLLQTPSGDAGDTRMPLNRTML